MRTQLFALVFVCLLFLMVTASQATIYIDEDFEQGAAFVDQNFPIRDYTPTPASLTPMGFCLRSVNEGNSSPKPTLANTGTITSNRYFLGANCLQLLSSQAVTVAGPMAQSGAGASRLFQFALSTDAATGNLPAGTQVGHFKFDWSTTTTNSTQASLMMNFVVNASKQIEVRCANNGAVCGTVAAGPGNWLKISIITVLTMPETTSVWCAYDQWKTTFKGPTPFNIKPIENMTAEDYRAIGTGSHIYINNSITTATSLRASDYGTGWGNDGTANGNQDTGEQGWQLVAENGGTLYIDNMYWDINGHAQPPTGNETYLEQGGRIDPFDEATTEPSGPKEASARTWDLY